MFCIHCGAQLKDGTRFCTKCGKPTQEGEAILAQQAPQAAMEPSAISAMPPASSSRPKSNTAVVIVVTFIAIAAVAAVAFFFLVPALTSGNGSSNANTSTSAVVSSKSSVSSTGSSATSSGVDSPLQSASQSSASSGSDASPTSEGSRSSETSGTPSTGNTPDETGLLTDQQRFSAMNLFLSNFSEVGLEPMANASSAKPAELVRFALSHDALNSPEFWESANDQPSNPYGIVPTNREAKARIDELVSRYMGTSVNYDSIAPPFIHMGGYVYFNQNDTAQSPQGIAIVTGSENAGTNLVRVHFTVVTGSYDPTDQSLYALSVEDLMSRVGNARLAYTGTAVVRTNGKNEMTGGLTLMSFERE